MESGGSGNRNPASAPLSPTRIGQNSPDEVVCCCGKTLDMVMIYVSPTTGGQFELSVATTDSVEYLKRLVSKRLRVPKERICLLYRDK